MLIYATTGFVFPLIQDEVANKAYHDDHCVLCQMIFMWNKMIWYITTRLTANYSIMTIKLYCVFWVNEKS